MNQLDFGCGSDAVIRSDRLQRSQSIPFRPQDCIDDGFAQMAVINLQALFGNDHVVIQVFLDLFDDFQEARGGCHQVGIRFLGSLVLYVIR